MQAYSLERLQRRSNGLDSGVQAWKKNVLYVSEM
jgi:hypothetical protein